jgi:hypothetical protein
MMEAARTCETSMNFYQTPRRNRHDDSHLHTLAKVTTSKHTDYKLMGREGEGIGARLHNKHTFSFEIMEVSKSGVTCRVLSKNCKQV